MHTLVLNLIELEQSDSGLLSEHEDELARLLARKGQLAVFVADT